MRTLWTIVAFLCLPATTLSQEVDSYIELLRADVRAEKVSILGQAMGLTEEESSAFWPIQRDYEHELASLYDERVELIKTYADGYESMTDETAGELADRLLSLEKRRTELKEKYFKRLSEATSPIVAARFLQIETQINLLIDLQIAASLPLISRPGN